MADLYEVQALYAAWEQRARDAEVMVETLIDRHINFPEVRVGQPTWTVNPVKQIVEAENRADEAQDIATLARILRDRLTVVVARRRGGGAVSTT